MSKSWKPFWDWCFLLLWPALSINTNQIPTWQFQLLFTCLFCRDEATPTNGASREENGPVGEAQPSSVGIKCLCLLQLVKRWAIRAKWQACLTVTWPALQLMIEIWITIWSTPFTTTPPLPPPTTGELTWPFTVSLTCIVLRECLANTPVKEIKTSVWSSFHLVLCRRAGIFMISQRFSPI